MSDLSNLECSDETRQSGPEGNITSECPIEHERNSVENHSRSNDIGEWPETLSEADKEYWISQGAQGVKKCQNKESNFKKSARRYEL